MAGFENNPGDKNVARPAESTLGKLGDAQTSAYGKNGQENLNIIRGQDSHSYPEQVAAKTREQSPLASLQNELNHLIPKGDHHKYTVTLSRKNGGPYIDVQGGDNASLKNFLDDVNLNCNEKFWNNINALTSRGQKVSFSVGGAEAQTAQPKVQDHAQQASGHPIDYPTMQKMEPKLDAVAKPAGDTTKPKDADKQLIDNKLANLIPEGVHLKFTQNGNQFNFTPDKYVDPQHWASIDRAIKSNPDLVNAIMHKMGNSGHLEIASTHKSPTSETKDTHSSIQPGKDGVFKFNAAVNDLSGGAQTYSGRAQEAYEPMYLGGHVMLNGQDIRIDPSANMPIPAEAKDGYQIGARLMQNSAGIQSLRGVLHTEGNAKYFRVQQIVYDHGAPDVGQNLVDIPLTVQNKQGVARY